MEVCALNTIHLPLSFSEVPPSSSPCLSHISQPQSPLSYERGSLGLGNQCSPAGSGCSTIWEGDQEGLSAHTEPPSPRTRRAAGQPPPVSSEEKHSHFPQCPLCTPRINQRFACSMPWGPGTATPMDLQKKTRLGARRVHPWVTQKCLPFLPHLGSAHAFAPRGAHKRDDTARVMPWP